MQQSVDRAAEYLFTFVVAQNSLFAKETIMFPNAV